MKDDALYTYMVSSLPWAVKPDGDYYKHNKNPMSKSKAFKLGRNAETGRFVPVEVARRRPKSHIVEHVPKAGYGDAPKEKK